MNWSEFGQMLTLVIGSLTASLTVLIPLYFKEKAKAKKALAERDAALDGVKEANDPKTRAAIKKTTYERGLQSLLDSSDDL